MARTHITGPEFSGEVAQGNAAARLVASWGGTYDTTGKGTPGVNCPKDIVPGAVGFTDVDRGVYNPVYTLCRNLAPQAVSTTLIAAGQTLAGAGALTLANASVAGTGSAPQLTVFSDGQNQRRLRLDTPRTVSITAAAGATTRNYTVKGYDEYGVPVTEVIPNVAASSTVNGKKALLDIVSVTVDGATATNVSVGTSNVLGLPFRADFFAYVDALFNDGYLQTVGAATFVKADANAPTATTGDVRGTFVPGTLDGVKTIQVFMFVPHAAATDPTVVYGRPQFS